MCLSCPSQGAPLQTSSPARVSEHGGGIQWHVRVCQFVFELFGAPRIAPGERSRAVEVDIFRGGCSTAAGVGMDG